MLIDNIVNINKEKNGCWIILDRKTNKDGYIALRYKGLRIYAHRLSYILYNGKIKENQIIRHTCDNPNCVNPKHLIAGTHKDNVLDRVNRGRSAKGEKNGKSKLTEDIVINIFNDIITSNLNLSKKYGVNPKVIRNIKQRKSWKDTTKYLDNSSPVGTVICCW